MRRIYPLDHPHRLAPGELQRLLGGKGFGLYRMTSDLNLPVPPGFTITTDACKEYLHAGWPDGLEEEIRSHLDRLEALMGRRLGAATDPLLVSVRSGAATSMPGMMDTILNLGLTPVSVEGLARATGDPSFASDCHRRFSEMFRSTVGVNEVPDDPWQQLQLAVEAVFRSWNSERAVAYREHEGIDHELGTAVTVQAMVFGNRGEDSATGVMFTRNPATGSRSPYGDVLFGAQGEDVVAGTHQTLPLHDLDERLPDVGSQLRAFAEILEHHHADLCDIEFTIEGGKLWLLQVRVGKRSPEAAVRIAVDMAEDEQFPLTMAEAVERVQGHLRNLPSQSVRPPTGTISLTSGLAASPGVASGEIAITAEGAAQVAAAGRPVVLVRPETSPADVHGMTHAAAILTATGGLVSHAAVVARGWGIPAVVGAREVTFGEAFIGVGDETLRVGETITIDGTTGEVFAGNISGKFETVPEALTLLKWAAELGIEIGDDSHGSTAEPDQPASIISDDDVIGVMAIKGFVSADSVAKATMTDPARAAAILDTLTTDGLAEPAGPMLRLSDSGNVAAERILEGERARVGEVTTQLALDSFLPLDHRVKTVVTRWQLVEQANGSMVANDHTDATYDEAVIADLSRLTEDSATWLDPLMVDLPRLERYQSRLVTAMEHIRNGDHRYFASPIVDSFHSVWFEIHEDLIRLAGSTRADETAAGRA
jgi:pyruvate, orthophosphate dikinase